MTKIVHAADIHLDSPLRGLDRYEGAPAARIRDATRRAVERLVELCVTESADLLIIAGDLYDGNWRDYGTGLFFSEQMTRLRAAAIPVVILRGNHDAASQIAKHLKLPENVIELGSTHPETRHFERIGVAVHGQSFATRAVTEDLAARYPAAARDVLNIGVLHTSAGGREGHENYAPTSLDVLRSKGYDYWALGHIHTREVLSQDPWVVFPGNLQGRHARETGPKGATLVTVDSGRITSVEPRALDVVRWEVCDVNLSEASSGDDAVELTRARLERASSLAEGRVLCARVVLSGSTRANAALRAEPERWSNQIRAAATDLGGEGVWVERIVSRTNASIDRAALAGRDDAIGHLVRAVARLREDEPALLAMGSAFDNLRRKLPAEARGGEDGIDLESPAALRLLLDDVEELLLPRLYRAEDEA